MRFHAAGHWAFSCWQVDMGSFNVCNNLNVCCLHEGKAHHECAQVSTQKNWKIVIYPITFGSQTLDHWICRPVRQPTSHELPSHDYQRKHLFYHDTWGFHVQVGSVLCNVIWKPNFSHTVYVINTHGTTNFVQRIFWKGSGLQTCVRFVISDWKQLWLE